MIWTFGGTPGFWQLRMFHHLSTNTSQHYPADLNTTPQTHVDSCDTPEWWWQRWSISASSQDALVWNECFSTWIKTGRSVKRQHMITGYRKLQTALRKIGIKSSTGSGEGKWEEEIHTQLKIQADVHVVSSWELIHTNTVSDQHLPPRKTTRQLPWEACYTGLDDTRRISTSRHTHTHSSHNPTTSTR